MAKVLSRRGYVLLKKHFTPDVLEECRKDLLVRPNSYDDGVELEEFPIYRENAAKMYLPRNYGFKKFGEPDSITYPPEIPINLQFNGKLREHQILCMDAMKKRFNETIKGGVVELYCGGGKTTLICYLIGYLKVKTLIIVHKEFLLEQWVERIEQFLPGARIGTIQGSVIDTENKDVVIGMLQSLSMKEYPETLFDQFSLTVSDETHHTGSRVFSNIMFKCASKYFIGLSATPERKDGLSKVFYSAMGDTIINIKRDQIENVLVKEVRMTAKGNPHYNQEVRGDGKINIAKMINNIASFSDRNDLCVMVLEELMKDKGKTLLLSERREHLEEIGRRLLAKGIDSGFYVGRKGVSKKKYKNELKESENKSVILATYQMAREGLDIRNMTKLVMATPMTDIEQAVGRILRDVEQMMKDGTVLKVVDLIDETGHFTAQSYKRRLFYRENWYSVTKHKVKMNDWDKPEIHESLRKYINDSTIVKNCYKDETEDKSLVSQQFMFTDE